MSASITTHESMMRRSLARHSCIGVLKDGSLCNKSNSPDGHCPYHYRQIFHVRSIEELKTNNATTTENYKRALFKRTIRPKDIYIHWKNGFCIGITQNYTLCRNRRKERICHHHRKQKMYASRLEDLKREFPSTWEAVRKERIRARAIKPLPTSAKWMVLYGMPYSRSGRGSRRIKRLPKRLPRSCMRMVVYRGNGSHTSDGTKVRADADFESKVTALVGEKLAVSEDERSDEPETNDGLEGDDQGGREEGETALAICQSDDAHEADLENADRSVAVYVPVAYASTNYATALTAGLELELAVTTSAQTSGVATSAPNQIQRSRLQLPAFTPLLLLPTPPTTDNATTHTADTHLTVIPTSSTFTSRSFRSSIGKFTPSRFLKRLSFPGLPRSSPSLPDINDTNASAELFVPIRNLLTRSHNLSVQTTVNSVQMGLSRRLSGMHDAFPLPLASSSHLLMRSRSMPDLDGRYRSREGGLV